MLPSRRGKVVITASSRKRKKKKRAERVETELESIKERLKHLEGYGAFEFNRVNSIDPETQYLPKTNVKRLDYLNIDVNEGSCQLDTHLRYADDPPNTGKKTT